MYNIITMSTKRGLISQVSSKWGRELTNLHHLKPQRDYVDQQKSLKILWSKLTPPSKACVTTINKRQDVFKPVCDVQ